MIKFNRLLDALFYYNYCVLCDGSMSIKNDGFSIENQFAKNNYGFNLIFSLEKIDKLIVNPVTEEVTIQEYKYSHGKNDYLSKTITSFNSAHYNYNDCFDVDIVCKNCNDFEYSINLIINLDLCKILDLHLSKTVFHVRDSKSNYFIVNDFYNNKSILLSSHTEKVLLEVPLINLDSKNLDISLERLKKLIIFS